MTTRILAGTADGLHDLSSGASTLRGRSVTSLAADGQRLWAVIDRRTIWLHDGGWREVTSAEDFEIACIAPDGDGALLGAFPVALYRLRDGRVERLAAFDAVRGRETWSTPWGGPPETRSIAVAADGSLYANVHVGGIPRSNDGGARWTPTIDVRSDVHQVIVHPDEPGWVIAATGRGLAQSRAGGESWTFETDGLHGRYLRAVAIAGDRLLLTAATGDSSNRAAVYYRPLAGSGAFERCRDGLPEWFPENIDTGLLVGRGATAVVGTPRGEVYLSDDAGLSWRLAQACLPSIRSLAIIDA